MLRLHKKIEIGRGKSAEEGRVHEGVKERLRERGEGGREKRGMNGGRKHKGKSVCIAFRFFVKPIVLIRKDFEKESTQKITTHLILPKTQIKVSLICTNAKYPNRN